MAAPLNMKHFAGVKWGNFNYAEKEAPRLAKLASEQAELRKRIESLDAKVKRQLSLSDSFFADRRASPHLASSGQSGSMTKKQRQEHYVRKGILEARKESERRSRRRSSSSGRFTAAENIRKTYKQAVRNVRKTVKAGHRKGD